MCLESEIISLKRSAPETVQALKYGAYSREGIVYKAVAREVLRDSMVFELKRPTAIPVAKRLWRALVAIRPRTLTASISPYAVLILYGLLRGWEARWPVSVVSLLGTLFLQIAINLFNDYEDYLRLFDVPGGNSGSGAIQRGWFSARDVRLGGYASLLLGIVFGIPACMAEPRIMVIIGAAAVFGVLGFSGKPFGLKYRALGPATVFALTGPCLAYGLAFSSFGVADATVGIFGLVFGLASCAILHAKDLQNVEMKLSRNEKTLASALGFNVAKYGVGALYVGCALSLALGSFFLGFPFLTAAFCGLLVPSAIGVSLRAARASGPASALLAGLKTQTASLHFWLGVCLCAGLMVEITTKS